MVDGYLNFDTKVDTTGFNKGTAQISKQSSKIGGLLSTALGTAVGFGAAQVASQVIQSLIRIGNQAIELASDLDEVQNVVDTAFGDMAYKCEAFADTAIEQFGMSKLSAKQTASTYMAMAKSMGLSMDAASDMAVETAKLTGDVASFYNISTDLASVKLKSIFTGETETLKDLGVVMTEVNLKQYALAHGITKAYSEMNQAEKVALRYNFVMDSLADAQGDFARTSDSWANQTRVLSERWKELLGILGKGLIRTLTPIVKFINTILQALINLANAFANTIGKLFGLNTTVKSSAKSAIGAADAQGELADETKKAGEAAKTSLASFDKLDVLQKDSASSGSSGISAGGGVGDLSFGEVDTPDVDTGVFDKLSDSLAKLQPYVDRLKNSWNNLKISFDNFIKSKGVQDIITFFGKLAKALANNALIGAMSLLSGFMSTLATEFNMWGNAISTISSLLKGDFKGAINYAKESFKGLKGTIRNMKISFDEIPDWMLVPFESTIGRVESTLTVLDLLVNTNWKNIWEDMKNNASAAWGNLKKGIADAWDEIETKCSDTWTAIKDGTGKAWDEVKEKTSTVWDGIKNSVSTSWDSVKEKTMKILDGLKKYLKDDFAEEWKNSWDGVKNVFKNIWSKIVAIAAKAVNKIIDAINWCIDKLNTIHVDVPDWVEDLTGMSGFGFNIKKLSHIEIPKLASGAVIPPNAEFMAMLGDQRNGRNLEAPEDLIRQIVREESGNGNIVINAKGTMGQLIRLLKLEVEREDRRAGKSFARGGAY